MVIGSLLLRSHTEVLQTLFGLLQSWGRSVRADVLVLQVSDPFLQGVCGKLVELIHTDNIILREHVFGRYNLKVFALVLSEGEHVTIVNASKGGLTMIEIILAFSQFEIEDIDAEHLLDIVVHLAATHVFGDSLCNSV